MAMPAALRRVWNYLLFERNPLIQLLYVSLMLWCKYAFVRETYAFVPNRYVGEHHKGIAAVLYVVCFALYIHMCRSDPGVVTPTTIDTFHKYPSHPVLFPENKFCRTCKTPNSCVGVHNYGAFILFLIAQLAVCLEVFYVSSSVFVVQSEAIPNNYGSDDHFREALHSVIANNQPLGFVTAVTFMIALVVWVFLLVQLKRITLNVTANESFKRDALLEEADPDSASGAKKLFHLLVATLPTRDDGLTKDERKKDLDASWGGLFSPDTILNTEQRFTTADVQFNPYNLHNFWWNVKDALFKGNNSAPTGQKTKLN